MKLPRALRGGELAMLGCLSAVVLVYFLPFVTLQKVFFQVDVAFMDHPLRFHAFEMLRHGRFPLWSDAVLAGYPLFAQGEAAVLYPFSWLYLALPPEAALNAFVVGHFVLLAASSYLFLRSRRLGRAPASFGALTFTFSSFMLVEHVLIGFLSVAAWLPALLWLGGRAARTGSRPALAGAAGIAALMLFSGNALGALLAFLVATAFMLSESAGQAWTRRLAVPCGIFVLAVALAAVQLLPQAEFLEHSSRAGRGWGMRGREFALPTPLLLTAAFPRFFGESLSGYLGPGRWEERLLVFVGWAPLFLALLGAARRRARFWALLAAAGLVLALEVCLPVSALVWSLPPLSLFRWPARALLGYAFGCSVLAAYGLAWLGEGRAADAGAWHRVVPAALVGVAALVAFAAYGPANLGGGVAPGWLVSARYADLGAFAATWLVLGMAAVLASRGRLSGTVLNASAFGLLLAGVLAQPGPEGVPLAAYTTLPDTARFVTTQVGPRARLLALSSWDAPVPPFDAGSLKRSLARLDANGHLRYGLLAVGEFDLPNTTALARSRDALASPGPAVVELLGVDAIVAPSAATRRSRSLLSSLDDTYRICLAGSVILSCRAEPESRAFLVDDYSVVSTSREALAGLRAHPRQARQRVFLEQSPQWPEAGLHTRVVARAAVRFLADEPGHVVLDVESPRRALLVLADTYYPGWRAKLDGAPVPILPADGFVRAVAVPPGAHQVTFRFAPARVWIGAGVSLLALFATGLLAFGRVASGTASESTR